MRFTYMDSLRLNALVETFAKEQKVYPTLATAVTLAAAASTWTLGSDTQIVPPNTITSRFRIDYVSFAAYSASTSYEAVFYKGDSGSEVEIGRIRMHPGTTPGSSLCLPLFTKLIDANTRISAKLASGNATANTVQCSIVYHDVE